MKENNLKDTLSRLLPIILLLAGITLAGSGIRSLSSQSGLKKTEAVIDELSEESYRGADGREKTALNALVTYMLNGTTYTAELGGVRDGMREGGMVEILVNPLLPESVVLPETAGAVAGTVCGVVLLAAGLVWFMPLLIAILSNKEKKKA